MDVTLLHYKPVFYGGPLGNHAFLAILFVHIMAGAIAPIAAIVTFAAKKGGKLHIRSGAWFTRSMVTVALTGIVVDLARMSFFVKENHTKYADSAMPSTYPARLGFMFAGLCILYLVRMVAPPQVFRGGRRGLGALVMPALLIATGVGMTAVIFLRLNPWTGALWMIWTFVLITFVAARQQTVQPDTRAAGVARHRFGMSALAAFSWWGALQGFGPAIGIALKGVDHRVTPYLGDQPGPFTPQFFFFLFGWAPIFLIGAYLVRRFVRLAARRSATAS